MDNEYVLVTEDGELIHWGIKGMKWGQRRYQNKDGSLTPAGKKRYNSEMDALKAREKVIKNQERTLAKLAKLDTKKAELDEREKALSNDNKTKSTSTPNKTSNSAKTKSVKDMTDEELAAAINRARMEDMYNQLRPKQISAGEKIMNTLKDKVIGPAVTEAGKSFLTKTLTKLGEDLLKDKADPNSIAALTAVRDKLKLKKEIEKLKKPGTDDDDMSWDDKLKKQTYEKNKRKEEEEARQKQEEADKKAKETAKAKAKEEAETKAREESERRNREEYEKETTREYSSKGGSREQVDPDRSYNLAIYNPSNDNLSSTASRGKSYTEKASGTNNTKVSLYNQIASLTARSDKTYAEIASQLGVSTSTVANYSRGRDYTNSVLGLGDGVIDSDRVRQDPETGWYYYDPN